MKFGDIIGQEAIKQRLIRSVQENRVSHAQLFMGPTGSGKLAMAIAYARYINCKKRTPVDACGTCPSCIKINKLAHPDLHFIYPIATTKDHPKKPISKEFLPEWRSLFEQNPYFNILDWYEFINLENKQGIINADDCNDIIKTLSLKTYESEYKIMIVWMAEKLYHAAAPKLLKILEEPPEKTLFILICEQQEQLLNTILSRTQMVKFNRFIPENVKQYLLNKGCSEKEINKITQLADGNLNAAIKLIGKTEDEDYNFENFVSWMRNCYANKILDLLKWVNEISGIGREKQKSFLSYCLKMVRESLMTNLKTLSIVNLDDKENEFTGKFAAFIHTGNANEISKALQDASFHIERNVNPKMVFLDLSLQISQLLKSNPNKQT